METARLLRRLLLATGALAALLGAAYLFQMPRTVSMLSASEDMPSGLAVVESFTSKGAAEGPLADEFLRQLHAEARNHGRPIYCLSYRVGAADRLGETESDANPAWTERQAAYTRTLGVLSPAALHMIVNGTDCCSGADRTSAIAVISNALSRVAPVQVEVKASSDDRDITVDYQLRNVPDRATLWVAWVEATTLSPLPVADSRESLPQPVNVVSDLQQVELDSDCNGTLTLRRNKNQPGQVIAFVQEPGPGRILGAAAVPVSAD